MPQGPKNGPKVTRSVEFEVERDLREFEVGLVLKLEFELEAELELELRLKSRTPTQCSTRSRTPSLAELPLRFFSGLLIMHPNASYRRNMSK